MKDFLPAGVSVVSASTDAGEPCLGTLCQLGTVAPSDVTTITVRAVVGSDVVSGTLLENRATAFTDTPDPNSDNDTDTVSNTAASLASLQIAKQDLSDPVGQEEVLVYAIAVTNTGPSDAQNVIVTDTLPAEVTFLDDTDNCVESPAGVLTCDLSAVTAGATESFLVSVRVDASVVSGTVLNNQVTVTSTTPLTNSDLSDNEETLVQQLFGSPADLAVAKTASSGTVVAGELVTYTLVVTNNGPATATDVEVTDSLPDDVTFVSAETSQGACDSGVTCLLDAMPFDSAPSTATITITARVNADVAAGTTLTNTAFVQASQIDPDETNDRDTAAVNVTAVADLEIAKSDSPDPVVAGESRWHTPSSSRTTARRMRWTSS